MRSGVALETLVTALERQKCSKQWTKDGVQFVPHPATWLNGECWNDDYTNDVVTNRNQQKQWNPNQPKSHYKPDGSYDYEAGQSKELESF